MLLLALILCNSACNNDDELPDMEVDPEPMDTVITCTGDSILTTYAFTYNSISDDSSFYEFVYDQANRIFKRAIINIDSGESRDHNYWEYDADGNCTKYGNFDFPGAPSLFYEYDYVDGKRSETRYFSSISPGAPIQLAQTTEFIYNGNELTAIQNYQNGSAASGANFTYSQNGKKVNMHYFSEDGSTIQNITYKFRDEPNPLGLVELNFGYPDRSLAIDTIWNNVDNTFRIYNYEYDLNNNLQRIKVMTDSNPNEVEYSYEFNYTCE